MGTILLVLTLCSPSTGDCDAFIMDTFNGDEVSKCDEIIIASGQKGAFPLRCEVQ
ncbi:hypothetical protein [Pectobacterium phage CX5]|uniref:Uncharacterized protein n=2 Tax=Kotilavirus TaxID=2732921 RepID=A0A3G9E5D9_9CAUD|nr:hypothetical protein HOU58_gp02 [Pectobacterium phage PPWS2]QFP93593.1 hypothetical protein [Pectobacterium phage CX5]QFP93648.1 hypothetical protein [Pectobacterium phage CX5-1]BBD74634.1 hypothetical protein [Pectobacterium phage PPWS2]